MRYEANNFINRTGRRITKVAVDGRDVTKDCHACDPEEGWVKLFERGPDGRFLKIYQDGKAVGISTVTVRGWVEVVFGDRERVCTGDRRHPDALPPIPLHTIEAIASGKNLVESPPNIPRRIL